MKKTIVTAVFIFAIASIMISSCKKKDDSAPDSSMTSEVNAVQTDFDDMHKVSQDAMGDNGQMRVDAVSACATVTANGTDSITLDFGNGCVGSDGRTRQGKLIVTYTGKYRTPGTVIIIKTQNYIVDGRKIQGMRKVTNNGTNSSGHLEYSIVDSDTTGSGYANATNVDGTVATWKSTRTREWTAGEPTPLDIFDDELVINGTADGVSSGGVAYSMTATNINIHCSCWLSLYFAPVSGVLTLTTSEGTRRLDYGNGNCDKTAMYTHTNGKTYIITLKH